MELDRRSFLATTATLAATAAGGCTGCAASPTASLRMTAESDAGLAREALTTFDPDTEPDRPERERAAIAERVVANGSAAVEDTDPPLPTDRPVVVNDGVYRFDAEAVDSRELRSFSVTIDPIRVDDGEETPGPSDWIRYGDLPAVDREVLAERGYDDERPIGIGTSLSYRPEAVEDSVLVPDPEYSVVVWPDGAARFEADDASTYSVYTYELTAERIDSAPGFGADLRERFGFSLAVLPREEREILDAAVAPETPAPDADDRSGYHVASDEEPSEALRSLVDRFRERDPVVLGWEHESEPWRASGEYVVRYDGAVYWASLRVEESSFTETPTTEG
ncbi:hypothetical protein GRX01_13905 [Halobaculum sp. WSA2]|uniref:Uncharacterized protein n=1 Tax=Halobaculum saliterrae TaxID=2073113 RepID=A0A6B0T7E5_9EURY|nr:hypothetical protein [Halobaculum saliterrae]MXR42429.1 hypothetical protein [Halobaculum saliterrae]